MSIDKLKQLEHSWSEVQALGSLGAGSLESHPAHSTTNKPGRKFLSNRDKDKSTHNLNLNSNPLLGANKQIEFDSQSQSEKDLSKSKQNTTEDLLEGFEDGSGAV